MDKENLKFVVEKWSDLVYKYHSFYPSVPVAWTFAQISRESKGDADTIGDKNLANKAYGLMQIRLPALTDFNRRFGKLYRIEDLLTPYVNIEVGMGYLALLIEKYGDLEIATRYYTAGGKNIESAQAYAYVDAVKNMSKYINENLLLA